MQKVLPGGVCDRPGFNTKSILLQRAVLKCWLEQMAEVHATTGSVSVAWWPQIRCFMWADSL